MSSSPASLRPTRVVAAALLALTLSGLLLWPTPYRYEQRILASVPPEAWGARPLAAFWVVDERSREGEIPVEVRVRRNRLTGDEAVEVWRGRRGTRRWFSASGFAASRDRFWAVGLRGRRAFRLWFPEPWAEAVARGAVGPWRPRLGRATWRELETGTSVPDPTSGRPRRYGEAMVSLVVPLVVEPATSGGVAHEAGAPPRPRLYLASRDDRLLAPLGLASRPTGGALSSGWLPRDDLERAAPLAVVDPVRGWRLPLEPSPCGGR